MIYAVSWASEYGRNYRFFHRKKDLKEWRRERLLANVAIEEFAAPTTSSRVVALLNRVIDATQASVNMNVGE